MVYYISLEAQNQVLRRNRMATLLLIIIYIAFMGKGVPDSLFGAAWPAIYKDLGVPVGYASIISVIIAAGTIVSSLNAAKVAHRFGTAKVTLVSTFMTAVSILGFSLSHHFVWLIVCSIPIGFGAGAIDAVLNNYVALHYKASHMNFMQCCYGIGVSVSPYLMSLALSKAENWNQGYFMAFWLQAGITLVVLLTLPVWKKVKHNGQTAAEEEPEQIVVPTGKLLKNKNIRIACMMCIATCGLEALCTGWGATFLVEARGISVDLGAKLIIAFYLGMTLGRLLAGFVADKIKCWNVIFMAEGITLLGVILLLIPNTVCSVIGLFLIGFNAILAPNILYLAPEDFGVSISQSVTGLEMAAMYVGVLGLPALFGLMTRYLPIPVYPVYAAIIFALLICSTVLLKKGVEKSKEKLADL